MAEQLGKDRLIVGTTGEEGGGVASKACLSAFGALKSYSPNGRHAALGLTTLAMLSITVWRDAIGDFLLDLPLSDSSDGLIGAGGPRNVIGG